MGMSETCNEANHLHRIFHLRHTAAFGKRKLSRQNTFMASLRYVLEICSWPCRTWSATYSQADSVCASIIIIITTRSSLCSNHNHYVAILANKWTSNVTWFSLTSTAHINYSLFSGMHEVHEKWARGIREAIAFHLIWHLRVHSPYKIVRMRINQLFKFQCILFLFSPLLSRPLVHSTPVSRTELELVACKKWMNAADTLTTDKSHN